MGVARGPVWPLDGPRQRGDGPLHRWAAHENAARGDHVVVAEEWPPLDGIAGPCPHARMHVHSRCAPCLHQPALLPILGLLRQFKRGRARALAARYCRLERAVAVARTAGRVCDRAGVRHLRMDSAPAARNVAAILRCFPVACPGQCRAMEEFFLNVPRSVFLNKCLAVLAESLSGGSRCVHVHPSTRTCVIVPVRASPVTRE
mmetsp:Transcript_13748/g.41234  ORF Transcript_13748/g.41234 Transcript_13748/m.41234 type:complete len:203 (+) Transcript_13748:756-1364(+)